MAKRIGSGYIGTGDIEVSIAGKDIVPRPPEGWTVRYNFYRFSFINKQPCHIIINDGDEIFLDSNQGLDTDVYDAPIREFIIVEDGVEYQFIGAY